MASRRQQNLFASARATTRRARNAEFQSKLSRHKKTVSGQRGIRFNKSVSGS